AAVPPAAPPVAGGAGTEALPPPPTRATPVPPEEIAAPEGSIDLLFMMDATLSMRKNWAQVTCQVQEAILRRPMEGEARVGFILYRDFDNQWLTRQRYMSWDHEGALKWFMGETAKGANAYAGSASDKALTVAAMLNLRSDYRPHLMVFADAPPNDLSVAVHRARLLHVFERAVVDGVYVDRDRETRGFMDDIARAGGGISRALRSGGTPFAR
ncbi:MAG: VWA domain-containing protein, partial [Candidatus Brocadiae bacterium]|nr:VWA domain-containing protein [Candidatus Brocadiia bacterium]